jgi:CubicO group peptidase (beta-lactamase class C family)
MQPFNHLSQKFFILIFLPTILISKTCPGQTIVRSYDDFISFYHRNQEFNGCVLVADKGKVIFEKAYGYTDYKTAHPLTTDCQFRLASVSKQFTGMAIMILKERGALHYDDKISQYLSDFPYENVTIGNLLNHTSGLPDYGNLLDKYWNVNSSRYSVVSSRDVYALLTKYTPPRKFNPGEDYQYCNTGYAVLALLIEELTGQTFQSFLLENIFKPLGMSNSYVNPPNGQLDDHHRAKGFIRNLDGTGYVAKDWHYQNGMYGDGGVISTLHDLLLWDRALQSEMLVKHSTLQEAFTQVTLNDGSSREYGFGWSVIKQDSGIIIAHGGGWLGYTNGILRDLASDQTVIQLCNMPSQSVIFSLWDLLNDREVSLPEIVNVTFVIRPQSLAANDSLFITGNHTKLGSWNPAKILLEKISAKRWQRTIPFEKDFKLEFKITRGSWDKEAVYVKGIVPENAIFKISRDTLIEIHVPFWKDSLK